MFYAARNNAVIGYDYQVVAFEKKAQRDELCAASNFYAITASELNRYFNCKGLKSAKRYPNAVFNENGHIQGVCMFNVDGTYSHMA